MILAIGISGATIGFYLLGLVAVIASLRVIIHHNPIHALLSMIVSLLAVAGVFFALGAPFAGALEIIVYAGAILVLFVFVVMMLNLGMENDQKESEWLTAKTWAVPIGLAFVIGLVLVSLIGMGKNDPATNAIIGVETVSAKAVGLTLFTEYLLIVEIAGFLLLGALVAAYHLAKRALDDENDSHSSLLNNTQAQAVIGDEENATGKSHVQEENT